MTPVKRRRRKKPSPRRARSGGARGSLRDTLVDAALSLIARKGPQGFSLREVARRARVSEAAPYWHFADREALLAAVAERGFEEMARGMMEIWSREAEPVERFRALGIGYVRFALAHPSYLRVMFGSEVPDKAEHPALKAAGERTFALLVQAITECQAVGQVRGGAPEDLAVGAWSIVHGLAALLVDGKLKDRVANLAEAERLAHTITDLVMLGLAPRA
ncbi:MAG TPA: TetR/AcrR family transcriptional regulator [Candidatus Limnocylindria bacterium]|nr:TetR/AcrR family transcriptional regulator [Candidatus Limnocylindria bacterium]